MIRRLKFFVNPSKRLLVPPSLSWKNRGTVADYNTLQIEEYQKVLEKNPRSRVFAALTEAYRKMGLKEEALEIAEKGIEYNPTYVSGLVAHAKILIECNRIEEALDSLRQAHEFSPQNLLALRLMGFCYSKNQKMKKALYYFKSLLLLNPTDPSANQFVKKWEFLEDFHWDDVKDLFHKEGMEGLDFLPHQEAATHIVDRLIAYGEDPLAIQVIHWAQARWGSHGELTKRLSLLKGGTNQGQLNIISQKKQLIEAWVSSLEQRREG